MEKTDKPRICEVLGVEVEERFTYPGMTGEFYVTEYGTLVGVDGEETQHFMYMSTLVNCYDRIIRKPQFTPDEVAMARLIKEKYPWANYIARANRYLYFVELTPQFTDLGNFKAGTIGRCISLPRKFMPSIQTGQTMKIAEILGEEKENFL